MSKKLNGKWNKKNARYEEIGLPVCKVIKTGSSLAFIIPNKIAQKHNIRKGDKVIPTLLVRRLKLSDELSDKELINLSEEVSKLKREEILTMEENRKIDEALEILQSNREKSSR